ncbi:MAG: DUF169 domain-containing protein [Euryarchaeota archaeon]|jgi:uncharacterized protein (DUF169 family)|uniref:DUF169 domain-containing protein n=1 Tax=Methanobacterium sp. MZD130B TaxID=3394378 RepID=UPI001757C925|nr:DUF169 domain-containing protein [Euryarchaeota archaeon]HHT18800.1 DUF169 domain-containing protein [Methanobacterium sp.]
MDYQKLGEKLKTVLKLKREPVAIKWVSREPRNIPKASEKSRFCTKLDKAMNGEIFYATAEEEECMGGLRYTGLKDPHKFPKNMRSGSFLVPRGVYKSIPAVQRSWKSNLAVEPDIFTALIFAPLSSADFEPDVIFIVGNSRQGMELLHANAYDSGSHGLGADSGPICSSMAAMPYLTGKVTYGFGDIGSRNNMNLKDDEIMISIPATDLERITLNLEEMKTKTAFRQKESEI